ncbi:MAG: nucleotidyltransferase family protein [Bryobacteraceae bacterium]
MNKDNVIATLRAHEAELKSAGVLSLRLFGSVARDEARPDSDVDLMARFDKTRCRTLLDYAGVEEQLAHLLNVRVDLAPEDMMHEPIQAEAERQAMLVF